MLGSDRWVTLSGSRLRSVHPRKSRLRVILLDQIAKIDGDVFNRLVTLGRILSEAFAYDALKFQGRVRVRVGDRRRLAVDDLVQRVDDRVALERLMARGGFIQNAAEGKNIRARIDRFALRLFGRHMPMVPMTTP